MVELKSLSEKLKRMSEKGRLYLLRWGRVLPKLNELRSKVSPLRNYLHVLFENSNKLDELEKDLLCLKASLSTVQADLEQVKEGMQDLEEIKKRLQDLEEFSKEKNRQHKHLQGVQTQSPPLEEVLNTPKKPDIQQPRALSLNSGISDNSSVAAAPSVYVAEEIKLLGQKLLEIDVVAPSWMETQSSNNNDLCSFVAEVVDNSLQTEQPIAYYKQVDTVVREVSKDQIRLIIPHEGEPVVSGKHEVVSKQRVTKGSLNVILRLIRPGVRCGDAVRKPALVVVSI